MELNMNVIVTPVTSIRNNTRSHHDKEIEDIIKMHFIMAACSIQAVQCDVKEID